MQTDRSIFESCTLTQVIDMPVKEFDKGIAETKLPLGDTLSLKNLLTAKYEQANIFKEALIKDFNETTDEARKKEITTCVEGLLAKMMSIEYKVCCLNKRAEKLTKDV